VELDDVIKRLDALIREAIDARKGGYLEAALAKTTAPTAAVS
jgi:hypothetical protein